MRDEVEIIQAYEGLGSMLARQMEHRNEDGSGVKREAVAIVRAMRCALEWALHLPPQDKEDAHAQQAVQLAQAANAAGCDAGEVLVPRLDTSRTPEEVEILRRAMQVLTKEAIESGRGNERSTVLFVGIDAGARWAAGMPPDDDADVQIDLRIEEGIALAEVLKRQSMEISRQAGEEDEDAERPSDNVDEKVQEVATERTKGRGDDDW